MSAFWLLFYYDMTLAKYLSIFCPHNKITEGGALYKEKRFA